MSSRNFTILLVIVGIGIVIAYAISHSTGIHKDDPTHEVVQTVEPNTVSIKNYAYSPQKMTVKKGTTVTWQNSDLVPHTVSKADKTKKGPDSELFGKGEKYSYTFSETGVYDYFCKPHPYMKATIEVTE
jgi:plastocyanin